jgi:hypothetical protein
MPENELPREPTKTPHSRFSERVSAGSGARSYTRVGNRVDAEGDEPTGHDDESRIAVRVLQQALQRTVDPDGILGRVVARRLEHEQADQPERDGPGDQAYDADQREELEHALGHLTGFGVRQELLAQPEVRLVGRDAQEQ